MLFIGVSAFADISNLWTGSYVRIYSEHGAGETVQYIKEFWILLACCWIGIIKAERGWAVWAAFFGYLLVDDLLALHENVGGWVAESVGYSDFLGLRPQDLGELTVTALAGIVFLPLLGIAFYYGSSHFKQTSVGLGALLVLLVVCGIVLDMGDIIVSQHYAQWVLTMAEDGGEMLVMSAIVLYALHVLTTARNVMPASSAAATLPPVVTTRPRLIPAAGYGEIME